MNTCPKVSVIIPVYNVEEYLEDCLDSILSQTLQEIEVICVNDGSTDNSLQILNKYQNKDQRITVFSQSNRGQGTARNVGIGKACGEYISFVDSDDTIIPGCLEKLYYQAVNCDAEIISSEIEVRYEKDYLREYTKEEYYRKKGEYNYISSGKELFSHMIRNDDFCVSANILFLKREWLIKEKIFFPEDMFFEDAIFCLNCYIKTKKIKQIPFRGYIYRVRQSSTMTSAIDYKRVYSWLEVFKQELNFIMTEEESEVFQGALVEYTKLWAEYIRNVVGKADGLSGIKLTPAHELIKYLLNLENLNDAEEKRNEEKLLLLGFEKMISDSNGIIIYGAGEVGQNVSKYLCNSGLGNRIRFYAVSEKNTYKQAIDTVPIQQIDDITVNNGDIVLLCANEKNQVEMKERLISLGMRSFFALDAKLRKLIREKVNV